MGVGIDIVNITRVKRLMEDGAIKNIFSEAEMTDSIETMAGRFAAKEAYFKAKGKKEDWLSVIVGTHKSGKPFFLSDQTAELSISHEGEYAVAVVLMRSN